MPTRFLLSELVEQVGPTTAKAEMVFKRDRSKISIRGMDSAEKVFNMVYELKADVPAHQTREFQIAVSALP